LSLQSDTSRKPIGDPSTKADNAVVDGTAGAQVAAQRGDDAIVRRDPPLDPAGAASTANLSACDGCRELTARIERLEKRLAALDPSTVPATRLSTTTCYWICLLVHALVLFCFMSSILLMLGLVLAWGACGTLIVCHVFSTRTIPQKTMRSLLSVSIGIGSCLLALGINKDIAVGDLSFVLPVLPLVFVGPWFAAKIFVWTRRWRLVPPDHTDEYPRLQIRHLLLGTLSAALYLALIRLSIGEADELLKAETLSVIPYGAIPALIATVLGCVLARIMLSERSKKMPRNLCWFAVTMIGLAVVCVTAMMWVTDSGALNGELIMTMAVYTLLVLLCLCASPLFTFVMLRQARYRLLHR
jgi:hypothetical protein